MFFKCKNYEKIKQVDESTIVSSNQKPCIICGKLTNRIDICYEAYLCGPDCEKELAKESK